MLQSEPLRLYFLRQFLRKYSLASFKFCLDIDAINYPPYAYGMYCSALQAKALGIQTISVIEFGVAAGHGLIEMERHAEKIENELGVKFQIFGFDTGEGLPPSKDYRDQVYFWSEGDFKQDKAKINRKLKKAEVIYGDVKNTIQTFFKKNGLAPIGFISFDLDYFSSTMAALSVFEENEKHYLPRIECYFDDVNSWELLCASTETGVLKAISLFNSKYKKQKILKKEGVKAFRKIPSSWNECMFVFHNFSHNLYNKQLFQNKDFQTSL